MQGAFIVHSQESLREPIPMISFLNLFLNFSPRCEVIFKSHSLKLGGLQVCLVEFVFTSNQSHLKMLYNSLIYPYLHYGNIVWANNYPSRLDKLFKLQKKVQTRIITFSSYISSALYSVESFKHLPNK